MASISFSSGSFEGGCVGEGAPAGGVGVGELDLRTDSFGPHPSEANKKTDNNAAITDLTTLVFVCMVPRVAVQDRRKQELILDIVGVVLIVIIVSVHVEIVVLFLVVQDLLFFIRLRSLVQILFWRRAFLVPYL